MLIFVTAAMSLQDCGVVWDSLSAGGTVSAGDIWVAAFGDRIVLWSVEVGQAGPRVGAAVGDTSGFSGPRDREPEGRSCSEPTRGLNRVDAENSGAARQRRAQDGEFSGAGDGGSAAPRVRKDSHPGKPPSAAPAV